MANNRQIPPLADSAFGVPALEALLRHRGKIFSTSLVGDEALMQYKLKYETSLFLKYIADADPDSAKELLEKTPQLAVLACGTVTTSSGNTYENVTAIQLAYLMDDDDLCNSVLLPYIKTLPEYMIEKADEQLTKKMAEVEEQQSQFKPYDFSVLVAAITADEMLRNTGKASPATEEALAKFKEDFKPGVIKKGKSFIKEHLQEGCSVCSLNWKPWSGEQIEWYLINIIGTMQCRVEKCTEQEFSHGIREEKLLKRSVNLKNWIRIKVAELTYRESWDYKWALSRDHVVAELTYRESCDSKRVLGRDYFVDIYYGAALNSWPTLLPGLRDVYYLCLKNYVEQKKSDMEKFKQQLQQSIHQAVLTNAKPA